MSLRNQIIVILLCFLISFFELRVFLYGIKRYQLNNSAYRKRKKGENFKEWLFYSRYKEEIPKILRTLYYSVLIIHPTCLIGCLFTSIILFPLNIGEILADHAELKIQGRTTHSLSIIQNMPHFVNQNEACFTSF